LANSIVLEDRAVLKYTTTKDKIKDLISLLLGITVKLYGLANIASIIFW